MGTNKLIWTFVFTLVLNVQFLDLVYADDFEVQKKFNIKFKKTYEPKMYDLDDSKLALITYVNYKDKKRPLILFFNDKGWVDSFFLDKDNYNEQYPDSWPKIEYDEIIRIEWNKTKDKIILELKNKRNKLSYSPKFRNLNSKNLYHFEIIENVKKGKKNIIIETHLITSLYKTSSDKKYIAFLNFTGNAITVCDKKSFQNMPLGNGKIFYDFKFDSNNQIMYQLIKNGQVYKVKNHDEAFPIITPIGIDFIPTYHEFVKDGLFED